MSGQQSAPGAAAPGPAIVEVSGVSKRFGMSQALIDVSMRVPAGDSRALVGRNGAGKSTLVGVLTGIISPDAGRVRFSGDMRRGSPSGGNGATASPASTRSPLWCRR